MGKHFGRIDEAKIHQESFENGGFTWKAAFAIKKHKIMKKHDLFKNQIK